MSDPAVTAIRNLPQQRLTFGWLRNNYMSSSEEDRVALDCGHAVLGTVGQLNQYLYTLGLMIHAQWHCALGQLPPVGTPTRLIDYGCGQGLGGLLINEITNGTVLENASEIVLIDPSSLALARATAIYRKICPNSAVTSLRKRFDKVRSAELRGAIGGTTLHLFSNTLDIEGYDPLRLLEQTLTSGRHTILAVSQHREFRGGTPRFREAKAKLEDPGMASQLTIERSVLEDFKCGDNDKWNAVAWLCDLEVHDG